MWAGGADGGAWIACEFLTKEPYVTYACQTFHDGGHAWASGTYAFGKLVRNDSGSRRFEAAGAFARIRPEDFELFTGVTIHMKDDRVLVPHGEIQFPFGDGHGKKAVYALGREISPEVQY